eukprot:2020408-Alexandrium_andersonii.AAC.1
MRWLKETAATTTAVGSGCAPRPSAFARVRVRVRMPVTPGSRPPSPGSLGRAAVLRPPAACRPDAPRRC